MKNNFMADVFKWLFIGLLVTFGCGYALSINEDLLGTLANSWSLLAIFEVVVGFVFILFINKISDTVAKILYLIYTALTGVTFGAIFVVYEVESIIWVFAATAIIFGVLAFFGKTTKINLGKWSTFLGVALLGMIVLEIINIFVANSALDMTISVTVLLIFVAYIAVDMWRISKMEDGAYQDKQAVYWAFQLYLDIINLIIRLLELFGKRND